MYVFYFFSENGVLLLIVLAIYKSSYNWVKNSLLTAIGILSTALCTADFAQENMILARYLTCTIGFLVLIALFSTLLVNYELYNRKISTFVSELG